jgi:hypothetical protein
MKPVLRLFALVALLASARLEAAYTYWLTDFWNTYNAANWDLTAPATASSDGFYSQSTPDGVAILKPALPHATPNDYEVKAKLKLPNSGGSYILYLRASSDARINVPNGSPTGNFIAIELKNPTYTNGVCSAAFNAWRGQGGSLTTLFATSVPCWDGMEVRAVARGNWIRVFVNEINYMSIQDLVQFVGKPGLGGFDMPAGNAIRSVELGAPDVVDPNALPQSAFATAVFDQRVEIQWTPATDDANGSGIYGYKYFRNGIEQSFRRSAEMVDLLAQPSTTYTYGLEPMDFHGNVGARTTISVTTPGPGNIEPRQIGVKPHGTYWGALGEQINLQSGNVNFTMPLFKAQARGGWGVTFALSYNSQNWRRDTAGTARTWNHGRDIGYGCGWRFLAGAMTPLFDGYWAVGMYRFMDSTGAEYRLTETAPGSGEWVSKEGLFVTYRPAESKLYFPDGSWWFFGSIAGGTEMDLGTRYPTLFQDRQGNQIKVRYKEARGGTQINGSGRIWQVEDVRAYAAGGSTFTCSYHRFWAHRLATSRCWAGLRTSAITSMLLTTLAMTMAQRTGRAS